MRLPVPSRVAVGILVVLNGFGALSALAGALLAIVANGAGVPVEYLANSAFSSYVVPGLILGVVVGGTQLAAATTLVARHRGALLLSAVAGFGMLIWIFVEVAILLQYSWLQAAYFALGSLELILVLALLGLVPALVGRSDLHRGALPTGWAHLQPVNPPSVRETRKVPHSR